MTTLKTGTREWSDVSLNIGEGCSHDCRYCYARANAKRFFDMTDENWPKERLKAKLPAVKKYPGVIMFPTTHDITPFYLNESLRLLEGLCRAGNQILIVTKPRRACMLDLRYHLRPWQNQINLRFTITSPSADLCRFWEPGAPSPQERLDCLHAAHLDGWNTSVSMEPMLGDIDDACDLFYRVKHRVRDKVWIGLMNKIRHRVKIDSPAVEDQVRRVQQVQCKSEIARLHRLLCDEPKVAWKDSIKQMLQLTKRPELPADC